jgi:hypothetical protein
VTELLGCSVSRTRLEREALLPSIEVHIRCAAHLPVQRGGNTCSYPGDSVSDERYRRPAVLERINTNPHSYRPPGLS